MRLTFLKICTKRPPFMSIPHPVNFHSQLTTDRLAAISELLLEELSGIESLLMSDVDDGYTRGCSTFGRQKNRIKLVARSGRYGWLSLANSSNDLVFQIGGIPCRFSNDDPENPHKLAVVAANVHQASFFEDTERGDPCRFCFVIDRGASENEDARVVFLGFDEQNTVRCRWESDRVRTLHNVDSQVPAPADIPKPTVLPKRDQSDGTNEYVGS
jgi:hypothetical protein